MKNVIINQMKKEWKDVLGFEGIYQVSNFGEVKSLKYKKERILKPGKTPFGHLIVCLQKNRKPFTKYIHHLVLNAFVGAKPHNTECRHFPDRDPTNNKVNNLSWATRKTNVGDRKFHGTHILCCGNSKGAHYNKNNTSNAKLTEKQVVRMRNIFDSGRASVKEIAKMYNLTTEGCRPILKRKKWKWVK